MNVLPQIDPERCGCGHDSLDRGLLGFDAARARVDTAVPPVCGVEVLPVSAAPGRVLAEALCALAMAPPFDNAAMDGFAVATADLTGDGPWCLPVQGTVAAGQRSAATLARGMALRIFTGAPLPAGADAVVMQEAVAVSGGRIILGNRPEPGTHIRRAGEDMTPGMQILPSGCRLGPRTIGAAAAAGHSSLRVRRRIRVGLVVTGDEVGSDDRRPGGAGICDVNGPMLAAELSRPDADLLDLLHVPDSFHRVKAALAQLSSRVDLIVTTGGVSVGAADFVLPALESLGASTIFSGVAMKPGKPVSLGRIGSALWLGLPGNPVSALTTWMLLGERVMDRLAGATAQGLPRRHVVTARALRHKTGRCEFRPARIAGFDGSGREVVDCAEATHSARMAPFAPTDGLALIPADVELIPEGGLVEILPFPRR
ncbi:MAG: molybdopterin molybdotransferase MoeA [Mangrovicoccus sp.]|nr:molybdopterin molybdotransferase MoeA [Mangrovicoccus sp.]